MGALTTAMFVFYMIAAPLTGWLGDRFPRKPLIIAGAVLWSVATLGTAWVHDYWTLYIRHALVGVGEATFGIFAPAVLADFYPERDRNRILSIFYLAIPVGAALGYLAGGELGTLWGWRAPFFLCAIPGLVIAASTAGLAASRSAARATTSPTTDRATVLGLFRNPAFLTASFGLATLTFAMGGISAWVPTFLQRFAGLSVNKASMVVRAITVIDGIAGTLVGGWMAQRWLRTNHRALYLLSFWSVALTLPCGAMVFFGPRAWSIPALVCRRVLSLPEYRTAERGHRELGLGAGAGHGDFVQSLLHSFLRRYVFAADYRRHLRPLKEPAHRPGRNAYLSGHLLRDSVERRAVCAAARRGRGRGHVGNRRDRR
jgi:MFS family permease